LFNIFVNSYGSIKINIKLLKFQQNQLLWVDGFCVGAFFCPKWGETLATGDGELFQRGFVGCAATNKTSFLKPLNSQRALGIEFQNTLLCVRCKRFIKI